MESLEEGPKSKSFFKYVFNFNDEGKSEFLNVLQFTFLSIIPMIILNKTMQKYVPDADEGKGSMEILAEVVIQISAMFVGFILINRMITFLPTYSGIKYPDSTFIFAPQLGFVMLILSLQTKLGEKINILIDRLSELWGGKQETDNKKPQKGGNANIRVSQPISQNMNQNASSQAVFADGTSINNLPTISSNVGTQQLPDYNNMHRQDTNPLVNAATPGMGRENFGMMNEPMAANDALGGSAFGSW